jgi:hypothetical protein
MRYLIVSDQEVFYTEWFESENNFVDGMIVIDLATDKYMIEEGLWREIQEDHL